MGVHRMATTINAGTISTSLPATGQALLGDITAPTIWGDGTLQYYLGDNATLGFDSEFATAYNGAYTSTPDANFAFTAQTVRAFNMYDAVIATDFSRITSSATAQTSADLVLVTSDDSISATLEGFDQFPGSSTRGTNDFWSIGVFTSDLGVMTALPERGGGEYLNWTVLHEIGHSMGLYHTHQEVAGTPALTSVGADMNNERYSVMSYTGATSGASTYGHAVSLMALDIAALQELYGTETYANTNSTYTLFDRASADLQLTEGDVHIGRAYYSIWDSGGTDTIDYGSSANSVMINLNAATLDRSTTVASDAAPAVTAAQHTGYFGQLSATLQDEFIDPDNHAGGFFSRVLTENNNTYSGEDGGFTIANGAVIENATGGMNDDMLVGNEVANTLTGNDGDDVLIGSGGNDSLDGGEGCDIAAFSGAHGDYTISEADGNGVVTVTHNGSGVDGVDRLVNIEQARFSDQIVSIGSGHQTLELTQVTNNTFLNFGANVLHQNDDSSSSAISLSSIFENGIQVGDTTYNDFYVNTNGNITFSSGLSTYTPSTIGGTGNNSQLIIAPFWADVDTRTLPTASSPGVFWDFNTDRDSVVITWNNVGYYREHVDLLNSFQMELVDRGCGDIEIIYRYGDINWTAGDASQGEGGLGGVTARAGFSLGDTYFEFPNSGNEGSMLNLENAAGNQGVGGVWQFLLSGGELENIGNDSNDVFTGTDLSDNYFGEAGNDIMSGGGGNDFLYGGTGNDILRGEAGNDTLKGGDGADTINGGEGDDAIFGGDSTADLRDLIFAGGGNDSIDAGYGNDEVFGQGGNDTIAGGFGSDTLQGQDGDDILTGSALSDLVFGNAGNDFVNGGFGHDRINGGTGADRFFHLGIFDHGSDFIQDYSAAEGDVLLSGIAGATRSDFQVNFNDAVAPDGEAAGDDNVQEAFVIYRPTGQILWALIDGAGQPSINLQIGSDTFDLLA
jgi:Ca2+-binding RTX toxin-like protein